MVRRPLDFLSTFLLRAPPNISMGTRTGSQNSKETMLFGKKNNNGIQDGAKKLSGGRSLGLAKKFVWVFP